jgi:alpha-beta hydrolase superfamily lysophospholipase
MGLLCAFALVAVGPAAALPRPTAAAATEEEEEKGPPEPTALKLETSDGISLAVQYFAAAGKSKPIATVILVHDLGGSSKPFEPLAKALQQAGCAVLVPDMRGHGGSSIAAYAKAAADGNQSKLLKLPDFKAMAATYGGRIRGQSDVQGDIEAIRHWIKQHSKEEKLELDKIVVVGSGLGAAVAATWTVADAAWPTIASGPQGGNVRALVLVDPAFATKGFTIGPALATEPVKTTLPILILAGGGSRDAPKIFDQLKRARPTAWFDSRLYDANERKNTSPAKDSEASLLFGQVDVRDRAGNPVGGDALAASPQPSALIAGFVKLVAERPR